MIQGQKAHVVAGFNVDALEIRAKELEYFMMIFEKLMDLAGLFAAFAASAILMTLSDVDSRSFGRFCFAVMSSLTLGFNLLILMICTMCALWGPSRSLRGDGIESLSYSIHALEVTANWTLFLFDCGMFCYFICVIMMSWQRMNFFFGLITTFVMLITCLASFIICFRIRKQLTPKTVTSGNLEGNPLHAVVDSVSEKSGWASRLIMTYFPSWHVPGYGQIVSPALMTGIVEGGRAKAPQEFFREAQVPRANMKAPPMSSVSVIDPNLGTQFLEPSRRPSGPTFAAGTSVASPYSPNRDGVNTQQMGPRSVYQPSPTSAGPNQTGSSAPPPPQY
eukprot:GDKK01058316.1.p1 GENE.GDKK01058316.1~~GDKK01058316.1.p1  ORF type:complete len:346 (-),score=51.50 GDKK01058316.1:102-1103(-)